MVPTRDASIKVDQGRLPFCRGKLFIFRVFRCPAKDTPPSFLLIRNRTHGHGHTRVFCTFRSYRIGVNSTSASMAGKEAVVFLVDCNGEFSLPAAAPASALPARFLNPFRTARFHEPRFLSVLAVCHVFHAAPCGCLQQVALRRGSVYSCLMPAAVKKACRGRRKVDSFRRETLWFANLLPEMECTCIESASCPFLPLVGKTKRGAGASALLPSSLRFSHLVLSKL